MKTAMSGKDAAMMAAGPVIGLLYVLVLPFAWFVAAIVIIAKQITGILATTKHSSFGWRPVESYLAGKRTKKNASKDR